MDLESLKDVATRAGEYQDELDKKRKIFKDAPLDIFKKEVVPLEVVTGEMQELIGKFTFKFLASFPTLRDDGTTGSGIFDAKTGQEPPPEEKKTEGEKEPKKGRNPALKQGK